MKCHDNYKKKTNKIIKFHSKKEQRLERMIFGDYKIQGLLESGWKIRQSMFYIFKKSLFFDSTTLDDIDSWNHTKNDGLQAFLSH